MNAPPQAVLDDREATPLDLADLQDAPPSVQLTGESKAQQDVESGPINLNPLVNKMADAQGVPVGSWDWLLAGPAPFSGASGEHASYGWRHTHKMKPDYIRAVLANYGMRRIYYEGEDYRQFGYYAGGRPHGWDHERDGDPGDQKDGTVIYMGHNGPVRVSGPEPEHLWLEPLWALVDDPNPIMVKTGQGNELPSNVVAKWLATYLVKAAVGMVRDHRTKDGNPYPWVYGDRATGRLLHTITEGLKRGCLPNKDVPTAAGYVADVVLAYYESGRGIDNFGASRNGRFPLGLFNGLHWILPVCWDAANVLDKAGLGKWAERFDILNYRWSNWMVDMHEVLGDDYLRADIVFLDPAFGQLEKPPESIKDYVRAEDFNFSWNYKPWAFRAVDIAAKLTDHDGLQGARDRIASDYAGSGKQHWLVDAAGEYV